jgi:hypothetical protein
MEKLTNVGQNDEKCLHTCETLLEVFHKTTHSFAGTLQVVG